MSKSRFPTPQTRPGRSCAEHGFTLVELMVAMTLGMLVVAALLALYINVTRTNNEMAKANRQIENGRFAIQLLQGDVAHAGFWGGYIPPFDDLSESSTAGVPTDIPDPCTKFSAWDAAYKTNLMGIPVQAYDAAVPAGDGCETNFATDRQADTDVLVVRHAQSCLPGAANCDADEADQVYVQAALCDLQGSSYRVDTGEKIDATDANTLYQRNCVGTGVPPALPIVSGTPAEKRKLISNIYYVKNQPGTANDGVPIPTLMRSTFAQDKHVAAQPLIEGIEAFRVEFLFDNANPCGASNYTQAIKRVDPATCAEDIVNKQKNTLPINRGDGNPDASCYAGACTANDLMNVVAMRIHVLARNLEPTPGYLDDKTYTLGDVTIKADAMSAELRRYKRHAFSTTVRLNNVSGRRETP